MSSNTSVIPSELVGTWSTGGNITSGPGFINPVLGNFSVPNHPGLSITFTSNGYFEEAYYTNVGNSSYPQCVTAVLQWQHGSFNISSNHTINTSPIAADGRMNLTNPCMTGGYWDGTAQYYYQPETFAGYTMNNGSLTLIRFDGMPLRPMTLLSRDPIMWPIQLDYSTSDASLRYSLNIFTALIALVVFIIQLA
ncbi:Reversal of tor2 lethality [Umbelopsis sp. WA50703]